MEKPMWFRHMNITNQIKLISMLLVISTCLSRRFYSTCFFHPLPQKILTERAIWLLGIVHGWHCFEKKCLRLKWGHGESIEVYLVFTLIYQKDALQKGGSQPLYIRSIQSITNAKKQNNESNPISLNSQ